ncbi:MAG TPA: AAA family ATPase, partial [Planctomycetaceae bacterium]|nr:AAA family ATPase [Planctomycetaceae bacterium]
MDGLNEAQRCAVETLKGPLLVLAGAGTGKTRVITYRIRRLIQSGVPAGRIWGVTFTNKAAKEMRSRLRQMLGPRSELPTLSTFHAYCVQILRRQIHHLGYPSRFPIYDQGDQESLARRVLRSLKMPETTLRPSDLLYFIGSWKSRGLTPDQALREAQSDREHLAAAGYRRYQKALEQAGAVDFDDLLLCTVRVFEAFPEVRAEEAGRFDHILVDEYQDTNGPQYRLVTAMAQDHRNLCVVGDDDQSIYAWRGA